MYDEPGLNEGACLRYVMNRNRQMTAQLKIDDEPELPKDGA